MRLSKRNHLNKSRYSGLGKEKTLATGIPSIVRIDHGIRLFIDADNVRYFVDLSMADSIEISDLIDQ